MNKYEENVEILKTIAHPARLRLMEELIKRGQCNVSHLVDYLGLPQSTVSQHLMKLKSNRILTCNRKGLEVYYSAHNGKINRIVRTLRV